MSKEILNYNRVSIIGLGKTGIAVANYLSRNGKEAFISEISGDEKAKNNLKLLRKGIKYELGGHTERVLDADLIIKSPGARSDLPVLIKAKQKNIKTISEIEFAYRIIKPARIIAITGTNGKTTTTTMTGEIFRKAGFETVVCGNIGAPVSDFIEKITNKTIVVLEVSSYQLEDIEMFRPDIACILNVTPDHLEHHGSLDNYIFSKTKIFENQSEKDFCVLNYDDVAVRAMAGKCKSRIIYFSQDTKQENGVYYSEGIFSSNFSRREKISIALKIPGSHNIENALASMSIGLACGIGFETIKDTLENFKGVEHRLEFVREIHKVRYINDSKSTNVDSTLVALRSFGRNVLLIMGGRDKGFPYTPLKSIVNEKVKKLLLIGEASGKIKNDLDGSADIIECGNMEKALEYAGTTAKPGDIVLLSPGCSSFDQFKDFEDRGAHFKELVKKLS